MQHTLPDTVTCINRYVMLKWRRIGSLFLSIVALLLVFLLPVSASMAQESRVGVMTKHEDVPEGEYYFWLRLPPGYESDSTDYPVLLFLHGLSLSGHNLDKVKRYGPLDAVERGLEIPAIIVAPQNPFGLWKPTKVDQVLDWVLTHYRTDPDRVYLIGMSLGGMGTLDYLAAYPDRIASAMAICGGSVAEDFTGIGRVPLWILHGTCDLIVPVYGSIRVVRKLREVGNTDLLRYDWLRGTDHLAPVYLFYEPETYAWLFAHNRSDSPRIVDRTITLRRPTFKRIINGLLGQK